MAYMVRFMVMLAGLSLFFTISNPASAVSDNARPALIEELTSLLAGEFDSLRQAQRDLENDVPRAKRHFQINRSFVKVDTADLGGNILVGSTYYKGSRWGFDSNEFLIWTFQLAGNGSTIVATPYRFKNQEKRLPFARDSERLSGFSKDDLEAARSGAACPIYWVKTESGFSGRSKDCNVLSTTKKKMLNWDWRYDLRPEAVWIEFFGTDENGTVLDGTPKDSPYRLDRIK